MYNVSAYYVGLNTSFPSKHVVKYGGGGLWYELTQNEIHGISYTLLYLNEETKEYGRVLVTIDNIEQLYQVHKILTEGNKIYFNGSSEVIETKGVELYDDDVLLDSYTIEIITPSLLRQLKNIPGLHVYQINTSIFSYVPRWYHKPVDLKLPRLFVKNDYQFIKSYVAEIEKIINKNTWDKRISARTKAEKDRLMMIDMFVTREYNELFANCKDVIMFNYFNVSDKEQTFLHSKTFYQRLSQMFTFFTMDYSCETSMINNSMKYLSKDCIEDETTYQLPQSDEPLRIPVHMQFPNYTIRDVGDFFFWY